MSEDRQLRIQQRRAALAGHGDDAEHARTLIARARLEGPGVYLEPLSNREAWNAAPEYLQNLAIRDVERRLGAAFKLGDVRVWECDTQCTPAMPSPLCLGYGLLPRERGDVCRGCEGTVHFAVSHRLATFWHVATGMKLNLLPGVATPCDRRKSNPCMKGSGPHRHVKIGPFLLGRWPVTNKNLEIAFGDQINADSLPAVNMPHDDTVLCLEEMGLRLPSPAEWEYACRAGTTTRYYWGEEMDDSYCWRRENSGPPCEECGPGMCLECVSFGRQRTGPPRPHAPSEHEDKGNAFGLVDMVGNVWEWDSSERVSGGSYRTPPSTFSNSNIYSAPLALIGLESIGFRAACSIPGAGG